MAQLNFFFLIPRHFIQKKPTDARKIKNDCEDENDDVTISMTVIDDQWNISFSQSFKVKVTRMSSKVVFGGVPRKKKGRQNLSSFSNK